jgi:hypothetical protein
MVGDDLPVVAAKPQLCPTVWKLLLANTLVRLPKVISGAQSIALRGPMLRAPSIRKLLLAITLATRAL